jgi:hypothetical protein
MDKQPEIEIWGKVYLVDVSKITIEEWYKLVSLLGSGNSNAAAEQMLKIVMTALPAEARKLSITALTILIPRVMEYVAAAIMPSNIESEVEEILRMKDEN